MRIMLVKMFDTIDLVSSFQSQFQLPQLSSSSGPHAAAFVQPPATIGTMVAREKRKEREKRMRMLVRFTIIDWIDLGSTDQNKVWSENDLIVEKITSLSTRR